MTKPTTPGEFEEAIERKLFDLFMDIQIKEYKSQPLAGEYTKEALEAIIPAYRAAVVAELVALNRQGHGITQRYAHKEIYSIPGTVIDARIQQLQEESE